MRPAVTSWLRNTAKKWLFRFFCRRLKKKPTAPATAPPSAILREIKLRGVRADWLLVAAEGVGVGVMQRQTADAPRWNVLCAGVPAPAAARVLTLCRPVTSITPADLGLPYIVAQRIDDGIKVYFGEGDDVAAFLVDTQ
jgi:hypothetical protein